MRDRLALILTAALALTACTAEDLAINDMPPAKIMFTAEPAEISATESVKLSWSSKDAFSCVVSGPDGKILSNEKAGSTELRLTETASYRMDCKGKKDGAGGITVPVYPLAVATLDLKTSQIFLGDSVELSWKSENSKECSLAVNGQPTGETLALTGINLYKPTADTAYELTCKNQLGRESTAKALVTVLSEMDVKLKFESLAALDAAIDTQQMKTDCGLGCAYADFDLENFTRLDDGTLIGSPQYRAAIEKTLKAEPAKVALFTSKTVIFDFPGSFGYGHQLAVNDSELQKTCDQKFPLGEKGARFPAEPEFIDELETNRETIGREQLSAAAYDIEVSGKAIRGVMKKDSEAIFSYKIGKVMVQKDAAYTDFDKVKGSYKLGKDGSILRSVESEKDESLDVRASCSVPSGAVRLMTKVDYAVPGSIGYLGYPNLYNPFEELCNKDAYYITPSGGGEPCSVDRVRGIDEKPGYVRPGSPRVIETQGQVQCNQYFGTLAGTYNLGADWVADAKIQYFVKDSRFKSGCNGADCASKEPRNGPDDRRFWEIEPVQNKCVERWKGLPWNDYFNRLSSACTSTQLFKDAVAKVAQKTNDENFARDCGLNDLCKNAVNAMPALSDRFSPKMLSDILDREAAAMAAAKAAGVPYFIQEPKLAPQSISDARANLLAIESGLEIAQSIHADKKSGWTTANERVHGRKNIPGFDSYQESKDSIAAYKKELDHVSPLTDLDMREISCGYDAKGRFRSYARPSVSGNVMLEFTSQSTVKTRIKEDTKISE